MVDRVLTFVSIVLLAVMVMLMWGKQERFDEKISWTEEQIMVLKGVKHG